MGCNTNPSVTGHLEKQSPLPLNLVFLPYLWIPSNIVDVQTHEVAEAVRKEDRAQMDFDHVIDIAFQYSTFF